MATTLTRAQVEQLRPEHVRFTYVTDNASLHVMLITWRGRLDIGEQHLALPVELFRGAACELTAAQSRGALKLPPATAFVQFAQCSE